MDTLSDLVAAFEVRAREHPALAGATLDEVIRMVPGKRAILGGRLGGAAAIFRFHLARGREHAARDWAELSRAAAAMSTGDLRVNTPLYHLPELGLVAVERAPGRPLMDAIRDTPGPERAALLAPAAAWLRAYTAPTEAAAPVRLDGWFRRAEAGLGRLGYPRLVRLKSAILAELRRIGPPAAGGTWRMAICHGDFHPNNLLIEGTRLTGIDTGGSARLPVVKDIARFLAHMGRRRLAVSDQSRFGVDGAGIAAFAGAFDLDETEREVWLPFMIGIEALVRVESGALPRARIKCSRLFCAALLEDLRALGR